MANITNIEWCDSTFNPWIGCTRVSPACEDCYAARSMPARTMKIAWGPGEPRHRTSASTWGQPLEWQRNADKFQHEHGRRRRVFCASLADVFDNEVPAQWRIQLLRLILATPDLDWLLLTKRIGNAAGMLETAFRAVHHGREGWADNVPPNVWLGITVVNQAEADRDVPKLLDTPAAVRFLSVEPMLGPINLKCIGRYTNGNRNIDALRGIDTRGILAMSPAEGSSMVSSNIGGPRLDWVICGGESGPKARPMHPDWARSLRDQCAAADVAFLFKQWGEWAEHDAETAIRTVHMDTLTGCALAAACDGFINLAGEFVRDMADATSDEPYRGMVRDGKKFAGRQLDGRTHDGFPRICA